MTIWVPTRTTTPMPRFVMFAMPSFNKRFPQPKICQNRWYLSWSFQAKTYRCYVMAQRTTIQRDVNPKMKITEWNLIPELLLQPGRGLRSAAPSHWEVLLLHDDRLSMDPDQVHGGALQYLWIHSLKNSLILGMLFMNIRNRIGKPLDFFTFFQ